MDVCNQNAHQHSEEPGTHTRHNHPIRKLDVLVVCEEVMDSLRKNHMSGLCLSS